MSGPLADICVLDLSRVLAGPWAGQNLADLGARVIKVEKPVSGDDTRQWGPPYYTADQEGAKQGAAEQAAYFLSTNRGKESVAIDFTQAEGQALIHELVRQSDIVLENYKVGGLKKYHLDYESLKVVNPNIIYCSITGFGQTGPYADRPGYDYIIQGMSGMMSITGEAEDQAGSSPQKVGVAVADIITGMYATTAVLAALHHRTQTGQGQLIDLALLDCQVAMLANQNLNYLVGGEVPSRMGNAHPNIVPYQTFATRDGHIIIAVGNDQQFASLCDVLNLPKVKSRERFQTNESRVEYRDELVPIIQAVVLTEISDHWLKALQDKQVPCGPINNLQQVFDDPQIKHRQLQLDIDHPFQGTIPQVVSPIHYSETTLEFNRAPPLLGQDTQNVLMNDLGLSEQRIKLLKEQKIIDY